MSEQGVMIKIKATTAKSNLCQKKLDVEQIPIDSKEYHSFIFNTNKDRNNLIKLYMPILPASFSRCLKENCLFFECMKCNTRDSI